MVLAKAKENPLTELPLRKGVFCAFRYAKASPFGRGVTEGDGEGKPGTKEHLHSDKQARCQSDTIAVSELFGSILALSGGLAPASSPRGGALGRSGNFPLDAESPTGRKRAGLATEGSSFWTTHLVKLPLPWTAEHYSPRNE